MVFKGFKIDLRNGDVETTLTTKKEATKMNNATISKLIKRGYPENMLGASVTEKRGYLKGLNSQDLGQMVQELSRDIFLDKEATRVKKNREQQERREEEKKRLEEIKRSGIIKTIPIFNSLKRHPQPLKNWNQN